MAMKTPDEVRNSTQAAARVLGYAAFIIAMAGLSFTIVADRFGTIEAIALGTLAALGVMLAFPKSALGNLIVAAADKAVDKFLGGDEAEPDA